MNLKDFKPQFLGDRKYVDKTYWILFSILVGVSIIALFSAASTKAFEHPGRILSPIFGHTCYLIMGTVFAFIIQLFPTPMLRKCAYIVWGLSFLFLVLLLFPGMPCAVTLNGATRWIRFGAVQFQPSEFAKLGLIMVVADQLSRISSEEESKKRFWITLAVAGVTILCIAPSNLSTAILIGGIVFLMWIIADINWKYLVTIAGIVMVLGTAGYFYVDKKYVQPDIKMAHWDRARVQVKRIKTMFAPDVPAEDFKLTDENRQRSLANVAVWRGGKSLIGVLPGNSRERDFLPLAYEDYIFSIIVEESGILGAILLILVYVSILFRACLACSKYEDHASMFTTMGLALMIVCQAFISMIIASGYDLVTGQPLPLISRGGSSVLATCMCFGVIFAVAREQNELHARTQQSIEANLTDGPKLNL